MIEPQTSENETILLKLDQQTPLFGRKIIFATDIDGTWLMPHTEERHAYYDEVTRSLAAKLDELNIPVVAVTGRTLQMVLSDERLKVEGRSMFDGIITSVGTEFYIRTLIENHEEFVLNPRWDAYLRVCGFEPLKADEAIHSVIEEYMKRGGTYEITQQLDKGEHYKRSYFAIADGEDGKRLSEYSLLSSAIESTMRQYEKQVYIMLSSDAVMVDGMRQYRFNIDALPVTKADALRFLFQEYMNISPYVVYAENSENGIDALEELGGIVVGGATEELTRRIKSEPTIFPRLSRFHVTKRTDETTRVIYFGGSERGPETILDLLRAYERWRSTLDEARLESAYDEGQLENDLITISSLLEEI